MARTSLIERLIEAFQVLPGVGPKSAQRMVLFLLQRNRPGGRNLAEVMLDALDRVGECESCRNLTETPRCRLCEDPRRDDRLLCVVESPADILALEHAGGFRGRYFVLHGHLSPIDGVGPVELELGRLERRVRENPPEELILATNPTVEGEATAHYISELLKDLVPTITRIAHGVPLGGELEFIDGGTLVHALQGRRSIR
ncbi:MAG: recombination mediator RecR [Pseudomonadales bacterium]|nr:recombination mediator RecR [Pseudomonadales bacterium]